MRWRRPTLLLLLSLYFIVTLAFSGFETTFALFSEAKFGFTTSTIGFVFAFIGVVLATVQGVLVGRVVKVVGERRLIPLAILSIAIGIGLIPFVWSIPTLLGALGVLAVGMGFNNPSLTSMVSKLADPDDQGGILGLASSIASLGRVVGPAWGGYLYDAYGMTTPYVSAAALMMIAFFVSVIGLRNVRAGDTPPSPRLRWTAGLMKPVFIHAANPGPMTGDGNWTYLIGGSRPVLIDAGVGHASHLDAIASAAPSGPSQVVVTHAHSDHITGAPAIHQRWPGGDASQSIRGRCATRNSRGPASTRARSCRPMTVT